MLICDKRRPARARGYQYQAPPRGPNKDSPPGLRPAPRALLGRGLAPPDPPGCAPWRAFAHRAPAASVTQPEGFRARVRRWRGWATACGCPCPTPSPSPSPLDSVFQKQGNRSVGKPQACPPEGVSPAAAAAGRPRHRPQGGCPPWGQRGLSTARGATAAPAPPGSRRRRRSALLRRIRGRFS